MSKKFSEYWAERQAIIVQMMDIALYLGRNHFADDFEEKCAEHEALAKKLAEMQEPEPKVGRPTIGVTKKQSITLPADAWDWIDSAVENGHAKNKSEFLRDIILHAKEG